MDKRITRTRLLFVIFTYPYIVNLLTPHKLLQATFPVSAVREGYRSVALSSSNSTRHGPFKHSSLFCRFTFE